MPYLLIICLILLTACAPFKPKLESPSQSLPLELPSSYTAQGEHAKSSSVTPQNWWLEFNSSELNQLVNLALSKNFDLATAYARLKQSQAAAKKAGAELYPSLNFTPLLGHQHKATDSGVVRSNTANETYTLGLVASYEADLWGRVAATQEAELWRLQASAEDLETAAITVVSSLAETWASLVGSKAELLVLQRQIEINQLLVEALTLRFNNAMSSGLDVLQQQELLAASLAELPSLNKQIGQLQTQLAVLCGQMPGTLAEITQLDLPNLTALPALGLPADLLSNRPDLKASFNRLGASQWDLSSAQANRLPALKLTANTNYSSPDSSLLFSNWLVNLTANVTAPLFDGNLRQAEVERQVAILEERVQAYAKLTATAVQEVENALTNESQQHLRLMYLDQQLNLASTALEEARNGYFNGRDSFLRYITQLQNVQKLERSLMRERTSLIQYRIALFRALGGSKLALTATEGNT